MSIEVMRQALPETEVDHVLSRMRATAVREAPEKEALNTGSAARHSGVSPTAAAGQGSAPQGEPAG